MKARVLGAVLTLVALAGLPLRTLAACTMPVSGAAHADVDAHAGPSAHAHHGSVTAEPTDEDQAPASEAPPAHEACPDLAACAAAAVPAAPVVGPEAPGASRAPQGEPLAIARSIHLGLEPPPPRP